MRRPGLVPAVGLDPWRAGARPNPAVLGSPTYPQDSMGVERGRQATLALVGNGGNGGDIGVRVQEKLFAPLLGLMVVATALDTRT